MDRRVHGVLLVGLVVVAGVLPAGTAAAAQQDDPSEDVIGWEAGIWHNESIEVDQSDGLSAAEREVYVARTMARVEILREREFDRSVPVSIVPRSEFGNETAGNASESYRAWNNQVWEALFVVGEDEDVLDVLRSTSTAATTAGYFFLEDEIKVITDTPERPTIDRGTLAHELVHAQQDQYYDLTNVTSGARTQDGQLARQGLYEGEANYIEDLYQARCADDWECVENPPREGGGGSGSVNRGVLYTLFHPYSDGPPYVHALVEDDGWSTVDAAFAAPPTSTEQIIHHTDEAPTPLAVEDEAVDGWTTFPEEGQNGTDVGGEASMFTMLWFQAWEYGADTVPVGTLADADGRYDTLNYDAEPTAGWANDAILPYRKETARGTEYGYVWVTEWDSIGDAREFREAYLAILSAHDAERLGPRTWVIEDGPFADAFRVHWSGTQVTIVNAPTVDGVSEIRPSIEEIDTTTPAIPTTSEGPVSPMDPEDTPDDDGALTTAPAQPGFGAIVALGGLAGWLLARRTRGIR